MYSSVRTLKHHRRFALIGFIAAILLGFFLLIFIHSHVSADSSLASVYTDSLTSSWSNWSWGTNINMQNTSPVYFGSDSIAATFNPWGGLYFHNDTAIDLSSYAYLQFALYTPATPNLKIIFYDANNVPNSKQLVLSNYVKSPALNSWTLYTIPTSDIPLSQLKGFALQEDAGSSTPTMYFDSIHFGINTPSATTAPLSATPIPNSQYMIYDNSLSSGWSNWSWSSSVDFSWTGTYFTASQSIAFTPNSGWAGLYLHSATPIDPTPYSSLHFAVKTIAPNQNLSVGLYDQNNYPIQAFIPLSSYKPLSENNWVEYNIPLRDLGVTSQKISGVTIQNATNTSQPAIFIDALSLNANSTTLSPAPLPSSNPSAAPTQSPSPLVAPAVLSSGYTTSGNKIYRNGSQIVLHGVNWFGAETTNYAPHGLWVRNYKDMISQMKSLGFNAVRLPVCPTTLQGVGVQGIDYGKNPDLSGLNSLQVLDKITEQLSNQQMYFLIDHHRPDCQAISDLWYTSSYSASQWLNDLKTIATHFQNNPYFLGIDLKNEPHNTATWGTGNTSTDWNTAAQEAGSAVLSVNPNILVFVEGVGENPVCSSSYGHFWGENLEAFRCSPISSSAIPANKLVLSPHVYGPDVASQTYFSDPSFPANMPNIWDTQFGFLTQNNTVVPGEWGGKYGTQGGLSSDVTLQNALVSYYESKHMCSSFYWSWNPNSTDTGGVLENDWTTPWPTKVALLQNYFQSCR